MSYSQLERSKPEFENSVILENYPVNAIRLVKVPHMSTISEDSGSIDNVRTNVGIAGELLVEGDSMTCRYNEYQTDNSCVIADLLRTECRRWIVLSCPSFLSYYYCVFESRSAKEAMVQKGRSGCCNRHLRWYLPWIE